MFILFAAYVVFLAFFLKEPKIPVFPGGGAVRAAGRIESYCAVKKGECEYLLLVERIGDKKFGHYALMRSGEKFFLGDKVVVKGIFRPLGFFGPDSYLFEKIYRRRNVFFRAENPEVLAVERGGVFFRICSVFREKMLSFFSRFGGDSALIGGIVMGEKNRMDPRLDRAFRDSGAYHLLVASGSNVGFVILTAYFILGLSGLNRKYAFFLSVLSGAFYSVAAGFDPPLKRAFIMFCFALGGFVFERESGAFQGLVGAAFLILIFSPYAVFDASFQMSFIASYFIVAGLGSWSGKFHGKRALPAGLLAVTFFAQLGLYPVLAFYFHRISLISVFSNILMVPAASGTMLVSFAAAAFGKYFPGNFLGFVVAKMAAAVKAAVFFFSSVPFSAVYVREPGFLFLAGYYAAAFVLIHYPLFAEKRKAAAVFVLSALLTGVSFMMPERREIYLYPPLAGSSMALYKIPGCGSFVFSPYNEKYGGRWKTAARLARFGPGEIKAVLLPSLAAAKANSVPAVEELGAKTFFAPSAGDAAAFSRRFTGGKNLKYARLFWPGESYEICGYEISASWPVYGAKGKYYMKKGFSGAGDEISWRIAGKGAEVLFPPSGRFIILKKGGETREAASSAEGIKRVSF